MTICVGMVCPNGVVVAGDTQESYGTEKAFVSKIFPRDYRKCKVIVAGAGLGCLIDYAKDKIFEIARAPDVDIELFRSSLSALMESLYRNEFRDFPFDHEADRQIQLLVALQIGKDSPVLFSADSTLVRRIPDVRVIGTETLTAIARDFQSMPSPLSLSVETGIYACLYTIAEAKKRYEGVGGATEIVILESANDSIRHERMYNSPQRERILDRLRKLSSALAITVVPSVPVEFSKAFLKTVTELILETKRELTALDKEGQIADKKAERFEKKLNKRLAKSQGKKLAG